MDLNNYEPWPALNYEAFKSTAHLLHMLTQMIGKLKLTTPFQPHWSNVSLWLNSKGLTTGPISYKTGIFNIDIDLQSHKLSGVTSWGQTFKINLESQSVAELYQKLFSHLRNLQIDLEINPMPQEISNPVSFDKDTNICNYDSALANAWWRILISTFTVLEKYHARFNGETPPIGFMWGTFDLRDARYNGIPVKPTGINTDYIRRNAMDEAQVEVGFWHGNEMYQRPAFYSFIYPQPENIENMKIKPSGARWEKTLGEFVLDYDVLRKMQNPSEALLEFFESTYQKGAELAKWDQKFIVPGHPK